MLFTSPQSRDDYFRRVEANPLLAQYGAMVGHAADTNLGIWGSDDSLRHDCARVMAAEVARYALESGRGRFLPGPEDVRRCPAFREAYATARREPTRSLSGTLMAFGVSRGNQCLADAARAEYADATARSRREEPGDLHERVHAELVQMGARSRDQGKESKGGEGEGAGARTGAADRSVLA